MSAFTDTNIDNKTLDTNTFHDCLIHFQRDILDIPPISLNEEFQKEIMLTGS